MNKQATYRSIIAPTEKVLLFFLLMFLLAIKVSFILYAKPLPDEAYYWIWSKNPALSYFDHPPLAIWLQTFLLSFSDNKYFVIRALPVFNLVIALIIIVLWQRNMGERLDYGISHKGIVLFLAFPIYAIFFSVSFPDHLLITLLLTSSFCLFLYFESNNNFGNSIYYWYSAVLLFALALLTKYNAVLFGIGVLAYILFNRKQIGGPSLSHIFTSTIIVFLIQSPVLLWNLNNDFASFSFHMGERLDQGKNALTVFRNVAGFLLGVLLAFSPIFIFNLKNNYSLLDHSENRKSFIAMARFTLLLSIIFCIFLCFYTNVLYYWLTPAMVLLIPFLTNILRSKISQYFHIFYGILISLVLLINTSVYPISAFFGKVDRETAILFGWEKILEVVNREKKISNIETVIFSDYRLGSLYIFHSGDFEVDVIMEQRRTQFDIWREAGNRFGTSTLIIVDKDFPIGKKISSKFQNIEFVRYIEIFFGKKLVKKYQVFLGTNA